jgi:hypothetical protein
MRQRLHRRLRESYGAVVWVDKSIHWEETCLLSGLTFSFLDLADYFLEN